MFLLPSNLSGSWLPPLTTLGIPLRSWQPFRSLQTKLEFLVILQHLDMRLFSVKADLSRSPQILEISLSGCSEARRRAMSPMPWPRWQDNTPRAIFIPMLDGFSHNTSEPQVFLQGVLKEAPELGVSVSIVASVVTLKKNCTYSIKGRLMYFLSFFLIVVSPLLPVLSCLECGCLMPFNASLRLFKAGNSGGFFLALPLSPFISSLSGIAFLQEI